MDPSSSTLVVSCLLLTRTPRIIARTQGARARTRDIRRSGGSACVFEYLLGHLDGDSKLYVQIGAVFYQALPPRLATTPCFHAQRSTSLADDRDWMSPLLAFHSRYPAPAPPPLIRWSGRAFLWPASTPLGLSSLKIQSLESLKFKSAGPRPSSLALLPPTLCATCGPSFH